MTERPKRSISCRGGRQEGDWGRGWSAGVGGHEGGDGVDRQAEAIKQLRIWGDRRNPLCT